MTLVPFLVSVCNFVMDHESRDTRPLSATLSPEGNLLHFGLVGSLPSSSEK